MSSAPRGLAPREGLGLVLMKMGRAGPPLSHTAGRRQASLGTPVPRTPIVRYDETNGSQREHLPNVLDEVPPSESIKQMGIGDIMPSKNQSEEELVISAPNQPEDNPPNDDNDQQEQNLRPVLSAFWERGSPDLPACGLRRGSKGAQHGPSSSTQDSRPSRGAKPRGADDVELPQARPRQAGS